MACFITPGSAYIAKTATVLYKFFLKTQAILFLLCYRNSIRDQNDLDRQNYNLQKQLLIEQRITNEGKSSAVAYILWWLLGLFGGHRFYLGKSGSAIIMLLFTIFLIGLPVSLIWWIIDIFLIPQLIREGNDKLREQIRRQLLSL